MNRHLLRCIVLFCLLCTCLLISVMSYADIDQAFAKKEFTTEWGPCPECQCSGFMFHYYDVEYDYTKNADGLTHNVSLCDKIVCESPLHNVPYEIHKFNYRAGPDRPHIKNAYHLAGDQVHVDCSNCSFNATQTHTNFVLNFGSKIRTDPPIYSNDSSSYHSRNVYEIYQCCIPECTRIARKLVSSQRSSHSYKYINSTISNGICTTTYRCTLCGRPNVVRSRTR